MLPVITFATALAYFPGVLSAASVGRWAVLAIGATVLLWQIKRPLFGASHLWVAALICWGALSCFWSENTADSVGELVHWLILGVLFLAASQYRTPETILVGLVAGLCFSAPIALAQLNGWVPVTATDVPGGLFLSRNTMGEVAAVALVWAVARKEWSLVAGPLLLVVLSESRGAVLACSVGAAYWFWKSNQRRLLIPIAMLAIVFAGMWSLFKDPELTSFWDRAHIWSLALTHLKFFGWGLNTFGTVTVYEYVHNDLLQLVFELGVGALLVVPIGVIALRGSRSAEGAAFAAILGASLVSFPSHHPMGAALVAVLTGLVCGASNRRYRAEHILRSVYVPRAIYERKGISADDIREPCGRGTTLAARP